MAARKQRTLAPLIAQLELAYEQAIALFPEEEQRKALKKTKPVIVVQTRGTRSSLLGWHAGKLWQNGKQQVNEITITAEHLQSGFYPAIRTLIHEMVHHVNDLLGVKDVSSNQYHNRKFADLAETIGLVVEHGQNGFGHTPDMTPTLKATIRGWGLDRKAFSIYRRPERKGKGPGSKLRKYVCGCEYGIRIAVPDDQVDLSCGICGEQVREA